MLNLQVVVVARKICIENKVDGRSLNNPTSHDSSAANDGGQAPPQLPTMDSSSSDLSYIAVSTGPPELDYSVNIRSAS